MAILLYSGTGPRGSTDRLFFWLANIGVSDSLRLPEGERILDSAISRDGKFLCAITETGGETRLVTAVLDAASADPVMILKSRRPAILFPRLSPSGQRIACLEAMEDGTFRLRCLQCDGQDWIEMPIDIETAPVPFDWDLDDLTIVHTCPDGRLARTVIEPERHSAIVDDFGLLPVISCDGKALAFVSGKDLVVISIEGEQIFTVGPDIGALAWSRDEQNLYIAFILAQDRTEVVRFDTASGLMTSLFTTCEVDYMAEVDSVPSWASFVD
ncbi:MAG: hypothetical protein U9P12_01405 [Verrucomicrobiota bacterium]|nr:hypothetical protein [Verrucomicrobiota bacterium]